jgi:hypothetical protein
MIPQIGDFIAITSLALKAFQALDSSRGSKYEFTSLEDSLQALKQAIVQIDELCMEYHASSLDSVKHNITKEREECEALITQFSNDFASYHKAFTQPGTGKLHQRVRMLKWIGHKEKNCGFGEAAQRTSTSTPVTCQCILPVSARFPKMPRGKLMIIVKQ